MIFLRDNVLLERDLEFNDVKPRLLGPSLTIDWNGAQTFTDVLTQVIGVRARG